MLLACGPGPGALPPDEAQALLASGEAPDNPYGEPLNEAGLQVLVEALDGERGRHALTVLVSAACRADPMAVRGANVIRQREVVEALVRQASRPGVNRPEATRALLLHVPRDVLRTHAAGLTPDGRTGSGLRVAAKGGVEAQEVDASLPEARAYAVARGAPLQTLLDALQGAVDGDAEAEAIELLGWSATDDALKAVASRLRTPRKRHDEGKERSVRVDVLEALHPHWPDEPAFFPTRLRSDRDYLRAERRAEALVGITLEGPRPPYFSFQ